MNITEIVAEDFKKFCRQEFPGKKIKSGVGYIFVQAGKLFGMDLHYEYYKKEVQLHCESDFAFNLDSYIKTKGIKLPNTIIRDTWQNKRCRWILKKEINFINDLHSAYLELRDFFEPIILEFENKIESSQNEIKQEALDATVTVCSITTILNMDIKIPDYQRPYKWTEKNIEELLNDIHNAIEKAKTYKDGFKYRIGSIILHKQPNEKDKYDIVDGQQRLMSLTLLARFLGFMFKTKEDDEYSILNKCYKNKITQTNIYNNYNRIKEWFSFSEEIQSSKNLTTEFLNAFDNVLEVVVIIVHEESEAFQLFDSQNNRGKALEAHDLLKAYHLREMQNNTYEMRYAVERWESVKSNDIRDLFRNYLYPILKWSQTEKSSFFSSKQIDVYKGIGEHSEYTYAKRANKSMPQYQITEPFIAGENFFNFVDHYLHLLKDIKYHLKNNNYKYISDWLSLNERGAGFNYARNLFYCAFLCYYDRFHNFNPMIIKKLFTWAFMIRVDMQHLGEDTIRKYAIGEKNGAYTNHKAMFKIIVHSRLETDISNLKIFYKKENPNYKELYEDICRINGEEDAE